MKLVFRADDFGYTDASNIGTMKAIDEGVVTCVELMLDTPGSDDALERIRNYPWISVNWHTHFWGSPVADPSLVPSMINEAGRFKFRGTRNRNAMNEVDYDEALTECRAEIEKCIRFLGKVPDATSIDDTVIGQAKKAICDEYGIVYNYMGGRNPRTKEPYSAAPEYQHLNIFEHENFGKPGMTLETYPLYNPLENILQIDVHSDKILVRSQHPGYLDDRILQESSCTIQRVKDVTILCSDELKQWIRENNVELINLRDALYGTSEYQNHLRFIGSDLLHK